MVALRATAVSATDSGRVATGRFGWVGRIRQQASRWIAGLLALIGLSLQAGCGEDFEEIRCISNADCEPPLVCAKATCVMPAGVADVVDDAGDTSADSSREVGGDDRDVSGDATREVSEECGDGTLDEGEACDDGDANSDRAPDACRLDCSLPRCGDGVVDSGESCDDGGEGGCPAGCDEARRALCRPCAADSECGGDDDACVRVGESMVCGMSCGGDTDCPAGYACESTRGTDAGETDQCAPIGGECDACDDADGDGYGSGPACAGPDCEPSDGDSFPGAAERCDDIDNDCDGEVDEGLAVVAYFPDNDGDGFGDGDADAVMACAPPDGYVRDATDCDDGEETISSSATERPGDEVDQDCDGRELCFVDADNDGYRTDETVESLNVSCGNDGEAQDFEPSGDCDDSDANRHPGADETPDDGMDGDCDGAELCYIDADGDGFRRDEPVSSELIGCTDSAHVDESTPAGDCDDHDSRINPDESDLTPDGTDQNCDGRDGL